MRGISYTPVFFLFFLIDLNPAGISKDTETCIGCHELVTPGIVKEWEKSFHAQISPEEALKKDRISRKVSAQKVPDNLRLNVIGCAECHTLNPEKHKDTFEHNGFKVHVVVSPEDCAICHPVEVQEYSKNLMSKAYLNLSENPLYHTLIATSLGPQIFDKDSLIYQEVSEETKMDACFHCHGTKIEVKGFKKTKTDFGEMEFPVLKGWPNQGSGRINPDGSSGSCTSCHTRHAFSIEMARKPYTCSECHKGPDVPAYKVYIVSKHGNIYLSHFKEWDFQSVPWIIGENFTAPTCAVCHASLVVDQEGNIIAERTHQFNDRLPWRIFGLIYAHPHPTKPITSIIKNKVGLPLPTELTGEFVSEYLIDEKEMEIRENRMKKVCLFCHSNSWVEGHFKKFENTIKETNEATLTATKIILKAWENKIAENNNIFNEAIEKMWVETWLFYSNSIRFASAMGGADYGTFAFGRWYLNKNLQILKDWYEFKKNIK